MVLFPPQIVTEEGCEAMTGLLLKLNMAKGPKLETILLLINVPLIVFPVVPPLPRFFQVVVPASYLETSKSERVLIPQLLAFQLSVTFVVEVLIIRFKFQYSQPVVWQIPGSKEAGEKLATGSDFTNWAANCAVEVVGAEMAIGL